MPQIRPGIVTKDDQGNIKCQPIFSRIVSLFAEHNDLKFAVPGYVITGQFDLFGYHILWRNLGLKNETLLSVISS